MAVGRLASWLARPFPWSLCVGSDAGCRRYSLRCLVCLNHLHSVCHAMTSEQAAQLIDETLDLVHQRLQDLQAQCLPQEQHALAEEFREWRHPEGGHIDLMVFPGLANP